MSFKEIKEFRERSKDFIEEYFIGEVPVREGKVMNPVAIELLLKQKRNIRGDSIWKSDDLNMNRVLRTEIESCKLTFKDDDKKSSKKVK